MLTLMHARIQVNNESNCYSFITATEWFQSIWKIDGVEVLEGLWWQARLVAYGNLSRKFPEKRIGALKANLFYIQKMYFPYNNTKRMIPNLFIAMKPNFYHQNFGIYPQFRFDTREYCLLSKSRVATRLHVCKNWCVISRELPTAHWMFVICDSRIG